MKAAVVHEFGGPLVLEERPVPEPGPGQVVVKMEASGLCHSDIHAAHGDWPVKPTLPLVPGHEGVGIVTAIGPDVSRVREGDRVAIPWLGYACGECEYCTTGWETLCERQLNTGYSIDGGHAEYAMAHAGYVGIVPRGVEPVFEQAPDRRQTLRTRDHPCPRPRRSCSGPPRLVCTKPKPSPPPWRCAVAR